MCAQEGRTTEATVVDHIKAHKGDETIFWDQSQWQSLCKKHHDSHAQVRDKTGRDKPLIGVDGWPVEGQFTTPVRMGDVSHPAWFRHLSIPLTIVCGPPASGKTTYVNAHKGDNDVVFDLDVIAVSMYGKPVSLLNTDQRVSCLKARNTAMAGLMDGPSPHHRAWLILAEPDARKRQWWQAMLEPTEIIVIETPAATCIARAQADTRQDRSSNVGQVIKQWWSIYTPRSGERTITTA